MNQTVNSNDLGMVAYFSMEIGLQTVMPTYSGGLGVLAGDTLCSAADLGLPMVAVSLLHARGYFRQSIDQQGQQKEEPVTWFPDEFCQRVTQTVSITIEGRAVRVGAYRYDVVGVTGHKVPVFFLHTQFAENDAKDQDLSSFLYGGDDRYRLCQETVLGMGGVQLLREMGYVETKNAQKVGAKAAISTYHMNEGHAALLTLALLQAAPKGTQAQTWVKEHCIFTTHTPVPAGHDTFTQELVESVLGKNVWEQAMEIGACREGRLNMSYLALNLSRYTNGVAKRHMEVSQELLGDKKIVGITNGVHASRWVAPAIGKLFDRQIPGWRQDNAYLRWAWELPSSELAAAHGEAKADLFARIKETTGEVFDPKVFTIGFARRATPYKRMTFLFSETDRLLKMAESVGPIQLVFAGKAHPRDLGGKDAIAAVHAVQSKLAGSKVRLVFLPNYDMDLGRLITAGVDLWLNNPIKPLEASGTSGMKAALNGVPSYSTLDGWWVEGCLEGVTGWEIDDEEIAMTAKAASAEALTKIQSATKQGLYDKLEKIILPLYYKDSSAWLKVMRQSIAINASFFNTHRMVGQYAQNAYQIPPKG